MEKPANYKFARYNHQQLFDWLERREPELAKWWDLTAYAVIDKITWSGEQEADIVLELRNKDGSRRSIGYELREVLHESSPNEDGVQGIPRNDGPGGSARDGQAAWD